MRQAIWALTAGLGFSTAAATAAEKCAVYELTTILRGKLEIHAATSPDPYYTLKLDAPICVDQAPGDDLGTPASGVRDIQLVYEKAGAVPPRSLVGQVVSASGRLHPRESDREHTQVLMRVESLKR
jgi:hypothetical protein